MDHSTPPRDLAEARLLLEQVRRRGRRSARIFWTAIPALLALALGLLGLQQHGLWALAAGAALWAMLSAAGLHPAMPPSKYDVERTSERLAFLEGWIAAEERRLDGDRGDQSA